MHEGRRMAASLEGWASWDETPWAFKSPHPSTIPPRFHSNTTYFQ